EHGGGMGGIVERHLPNLRNRMEGVERWFTPWPDVETFPRRMLARTEQTTFRIFRAEMLFLTIAAVALCAAGWSGFLRSGGSAAAISAGLAATSFGLVVMRMLAMRFMQLCWRRCYTDKRSFMFGTLSRGERWINRAAFFGKLQGLAMIAGAATLA